MGSTHRATCTCGYESMVTVGGTKATFREVSYFPHYCRDCGLVEVNIAAVKGPKVPCPKCGQRDTHAYGTKTVSDSKSRSQVAIAWGTYEAKEVGNRCPACKGMTLVFHRGPEMQFD